MTPHQKLIRATQLEAEARQLRAEAEAEGECLELGDPASAPDPTDRSLREHEGLSAFHGELSAAEEERRLEQQFCDVVCDDKRRLKEEIADMQARLRRRGGKSDDDQYGPPAA